MASMRIFGLHPVPTRQDMNTEGQVLIWRRALSSWGVMLVGGLRAGDIWLPLRVAPSAEILEQAEAVRKVR